MIKRLVIFFICLLLGNVCLFYREIERYNKEIIKFEEYLNNYCINGVNGEEVYVVFDYEKIESYLKENMTNTYLEKDSLTGFNVGVDIQKGIFLKRDKESFYLRKGVLYDSWN